MKDAYTMAAHFKAMGIGRQDSWSRWVQYTSLRPNMDAKDWYKIYDTVSPMRIMEEPRPSMGEATHRITYIYGELSRLVRATHQTEHVVSWVDEDGFTGSDPMHTVILEKLGEETEQ